MVAYGVLDFGRDFVVLSPETLASGGRERVRSSGRCDGLLRGSNRKWERHEKVSALKGNAHLMVCAAGARMPAEDLRRRFLA